VDGFVTALMDIAAVLGLERDSYACLLDVPEMIVARLDAVEVTLREAKG
jgi:hypothetical protein